MKWVSIFVYNLLYVLFAFVSYSSFLFFFSSSSFLFPQLLLFSICIFLFLVQWKHLDLFLYMSYPLFHFRSSLFSFFQSGDRRQPLHLRSFFLFLSTTLSYSIYSVISLSSSLFFSFRSLLTSLGIDQESFSLVSIS